MKPVNIGAAKANFSGLVKEAAAGGEIVIAKAGKPVARLMPLPKNDFRRTFGRLKGKIKMSDDFDAPLSPELLKAFGIEE